MSNYAPNHPTIELIKTLVSQFPAEDQLAFDGGPAHIALADYNLSDENIAWCMNNIKSWLKDLDTVPLYPAFEGWTVGKCIVILGETYKLLETLLYIPEKEREVY